MVVFAPDEIGLADKSPCAGIRADLKMCLLSSDCCRKVLSSKIWGFHASCPGCQILEMATLTTHQCFLYVVKHFQDKKTPRECLKSRTVEDECLQLQQSFFECKRSLLDNRRRFRGHKGY